MTTTGVLRAMYVAARRGEPLAAVNRVRAVPGRGLVGDRYYLGRSSLSRWPRPERAVSLIEQEGLDYALQAHGIDLGAGRSRRNLVTVDISLAALIGPRFRIGTVLFQGVGPCTSCRYLERNEGPGAFAALTGRGGLRAEVLAEGVLALGDAVEVFDAGASRSAAAE
jgi:MOSC domain-containing protein YiiM